MIWTNLRSWKGTEDPSTFLLLEKNWQNAFDLLWTQNGHKCDFEDSFIAVALGRFFPLTCCVERKNYDTRNPGPFEDEFRCSEKLFTWSKTFCCYDSASNKLKVSIRGIKNWIIEHSGECPLEKWCKNLDDAMNKKSTHRGFRTKDLTAN